MSLKQFLNSEFWEMYRRVFIMDVDYISTFLQPDVVQGIEMGYTDVQSVFDFINDALFLYEKTHDKELTVVYEHLDAIYDSKKEDLDNPVALDIMEFEIIG